MALPAQIGRYRIEREVARGGMGAVYAARARDGRPVALKVLLSGKTASALQRRRVATEIQTLLRLRHPHVVALLDAGEHEGVPWLAMEWIEGETLAARLRREGPLDPRAAASLVARLAGALEHCHAQGVLHRDLKPENVMLRAGDGAPLLTDFGLSKDLASESQPSLSRAGLWLGTPGWWPPEQARGDRAAIGPRSDVYGLGAVLYGCLTGEAPQEGQSLVELIEATTRPPLAPGRRRQGVPPWLDALCLRALELDPAARPAGPAELARALEDGLARRPTPGRVSAAALPAAALLVVAGATAGAVVAWRGGAPAPATPPPAPPQEPADPRAEAQRLRLRATDRLDLTGDLVAALADYDRSIDLDPRNARTYLERGAALLRRGDLVAAHADYDRAIDLDPQLAQAHLERGDVRQRQGDLAAALADYDRAIELDPQLALAWRNRGVVRELQGDLPAARADYDRAIDLEPQLALAWFNRGVLRHQQGDWAGTLDDLDTAIDLEPGFARAWHYRSAVREQQGDLPAALADLDRAIALEPQFALAYLDRGDLREKLGDLAAALADCDHALDVEPRFAVAYLQRANLRERRGDLAAALADCDRFLELAPDDPKAPAVRAVADRLRGQLGRR